ncbi:hypothetical protein [Saccharospirillum mangrovi]|uniref:hypothetical protein n=1 Tax=Saccharospirillum mangrovi TaxID=2161747 RepID=UPI000D359A74|nr:hypothetical protein [Saccharospirillum mangrovi]
MDGRLIVDASCHLPDGLLARLNIERLHDPALFEQRLLDAWLYHGDDWLVLASPQRINDWQVAVQCHQSAFAELRLAARLQRPFRIRFIASEARSAHLGLIAAQLAQRLADGQSIDSFWAQQRAVEQSIHAVLAVNSESNWLRALPWRQRWRSMPALLSVENGRSRRLGSGSTPLDAFLHYADQHIPAGAHINLSYAGNPSQLQQAPGFQDACLQRSQAGGLCWLSEMDAEGVRQCGPDALSIAWLNAPARCERP